MYKVWDGTQWSGVKALKVWNGTSWKAGLKFKVRTSTSWLPGSISDKDDSQIIKWSVEGPTPPPPPPPVTHQVPNLNLKTIAEVTDLLTPLNFTYAISGYETTSVNANDDKVVTNSQVPAAGEVMAEGGQVVFKLYNFVQPTTTVPNLNGLLKTAAETAITNANLVVGSPLDTDQTYDTNKIGRVIDNSQYPSAGSTVDVGTSVVFDYWIQKPYATVPNLVGLTDANVYSTLSAETLTIGSRTVEATAVAGNDEKVKSQYPVSGTQVQQGSAVDYVVYDYTLRYVPNLNGLTQAQATQALSDAGLYAGNITNQETTVVSDEGKVKANSQSHPAGSTVNQGTSINFTVWVPNTTTVVPNFVGLTTTQVNSTAATAEVNVNIRNVVYTNDTSLHVKVKSQETAAGTTVNIWTTIWVDLWAPFPTYTVPSIIGQTPSTGAIDSNFTWGSNTLAATGTETVSNFGKVATQSPTAGSSSQAGEINYGVYTDSRPTVPNVVGQTQSTAQTNISNAGLNYSVTTKAQTFNGQATAGTVNSQSPAAGTRLASGGTVTIEVWAAYVPQAVTRTSSVLIGDNAFSGYYTKTGTWVPYTAGALDWKNQARFKLTATTGTKDASSTYQRMTGYVGWQNSTNGNWATMYDFNKADVESLITGSITGGVTPTYTSAEFTFQVGTAGTNGKTWYLDYLSSIPATLTQSSILNTQNIGTGIINNGDVMAPTLNATMKTQIWDYDGAIIVHNKNTNAAATHYGSITWAYLRVYFTWTEYV